MSLTYYVLAAGGTGGHMIPAHALAEELLMRGHRVALITDDQKNQVLSDPHYQLCDLRIQWMRKQVQTRRERLTDKPSVAQP